MEPGTVLWSQALLLEPGTVIGARHCIWSQALLFGARHCLLEPGTVYWSQALLMEHAAREDEERCHSVVPRGYLTVPGMWYRG